MTSRMRFVTFEKLIDLTVVIAGILIAISMNTCVENRAFKKDWEEHRVLFVQSIEATKTDYVENLEKVKAQVALGEAAIKDAKVEGKIDKENINKFISSLGSLNITAAINEGLYKSFLTSKNPYFLKNYDQMVAFEEFFSFKESAMIFADMYVQISLPELFSFYRKTLNEKYLESDIGRKELTFFLEFQKGFIGGMIVQYEEQIKKADKLLGILKN